MCKWIKDILFPTNVLGNKKNSIRIDLPDLQIGENLVGIDWIGDRIDVTWTYRITDMQQRHVTYEQHHETFYDADQREDVITLIEVYNAHVIQRVSDACIYINCTNVTQLLVNGEQYI